jgi:hypothetical protein
MHVRSLIGQKLKTSNFVEELTELASFKGERPHASLASDYCRVRPFSKEQGFGHLADANIAKSRRESVDRLFRLNHATRLGQFDPALVHQVEICSLGWLASQ